MSEESNVVAPNLSEIMDAEQSSFQNFMILVIEPRPNVDSVKLIVDDGVVRLTLRRDQFISMLKDIIDIDDPAIRPTYYKIIQAIHSYDGVYFYDRVQNVFRELTELPDIEQIDPRDLLEKSQIETSTKVLYTNNFHQLKKDAQSYQKIQSPFAKRLQALYSKYNVVLRNFTESKKGKKV